MLRCGEERSSLLDDSPALHSPRQRQVVPHDASLCQ